MGSAKLATEWKGLHFIKETSVTLVNERTVKASERAGEVSHGINEAGGPHEAFGTQCGLSPTQCKL